MEGNAVRSAAKCQIPADGNRIATSSVRPPLLSTDCRSVWNLRRCC